MTAAIVMRDSDEAAQYRTDIKGWVSRNGIYYGDSVHSERVARYDGCTHVPCGNCGEPTPKHWTLCKPCRSVAEKGRYEAMPEAEWDGKAVLYSDLNDSYYPGLDEIEDYLEDLNDGTTLEDLRLIICEPNFVRPLDIDYFSEELPEDGDLPTEVEDAMKDFNEAVKGIVLSWSPGRKRLSLGGSHDYQKR